MSEIQRRDFLKAGTAGLAGATVINQTGLQKTVLGASAPVSLNYAYLFELGTTSRLDPKTRAVQGTNPWAIRSENAGVTGELLSPLTISPSSLITLQGSSDQLSETRKIIGRESATLNALMQVQFEGLIDGIDDSAEIATALFSGLSLDLSLEFFNDESWTAVPKKGVANLNGIPIIEASPFVNDFIEKSRTPNAVNTPTLFGWKFVFHGPETGRFGSCVTTNVRHFNVEIHREIPGRRGRFQVVLNFHLGTYKDGTRRCFALYQNQRPYTFCLKKCSPTRKDLVSMFKSVLAAAVALAGAALAAWQVAAIAEGAGALMFIPLLAL